MTDATHDGLPFRRKVIVVIAIVAAVVVLDLATKAIAERALTHEAEPRTYLGDMVRLGFVMNRGVFLSLGQTLSDAARFWLFVVGVSAVLVTLLVLTLSDARFRTPEVVAVAAIVGGGIGNLADRIQLHAVRDFLNVGIGPVRTGVFNVADMAITFGGIALLLLPLMKKRTRAGS